MQLSAKSEGIARLISVAFMLCLCAPAQADQKKAPAVLARDLKIMSWTPADGAHLPGPGHHFIKIVFNKSIFDFKRRTLLVVGPGTSVYAQSSLSDKDTTINADVGDLRPGSFAMVLGLQNPEFPKETFSKQGNFIVDGVPVSNIEAPK